MKRVMMAVAVATMLAAPASGAAGAGPPQTQSQTRLQTQSQVKAKDGTCDGTQKRLHQQGGMKQQLRTQAKADAKGGGHMYRGGRGR